MRKLFYQKIANEYLEYKSSVLMCTNKEIYGRSYEIEIMVNLYEIFLEIGERLSNSVLTVLLSKQNILGWFYELWMTKDDNSYDKILACVNDELIKMNGR